MANDREHNEQAMLFSWAATRPDLDCMFAIPNGGHRHKATAGKLKAEGVKAGVPDIFLPVSRGPYYGLFVEMKAPECKPLGYKAGRLSVFQKLWLDMLSENGYATAVCYGFDDAKEVITEYMDREGGV